MEKRGQVAMEFLMTYGWAILIILVAVAVLWMLGVFNPTAPTHCSIEAPVNCADAVVDDTGVTLKLALAGGFTGTVTNMEVNGQTCDSLLGTSLTGGQQSSVRCVLPGLERDEKVSASFKVNSKRVGGLPQITEGELSGEVKEVNYAQNADPSLILAYDFEGNAKDTTTNNNDGTLNGDTDCSVSGHNGNACYFDGNGDYIELADNPTFDDITTEMSYEMWVYPEATGSGAYSASEKGWNVLRVVHSGSSNWLKIIQSTAAGDIDIESGSNTVNPNNWYHLAFTYDGSVGRLYLDGQEVNTQSISSTPNMGNTPYRVGTYLAGPQHFQGKIDDIALYNRVLSAQEIQDHAFA